MSDSTYSTLRQASQVLSLLSKKGTSRGQVQKLFTSGFLSDLLDANLDNVDRDEFRKMLGLIKLKTSTTILSNTIISVDRSVSQFVPPEQGLGRMLHPKLGMTGPRRYNLGQVEIFAHRKERADNWLDRKNVYDILLRDGILPNCLSLKDGKEIQKKGLSIFREFSKGKDVFLWKSIVEDECHLRRVPCLNEADGKVNIKWVVAVDNFGENDVGAYFR